MFHDFTPLPALLGGALIGTSASLILLGLGRVAGISGLVGGLLAPSTGEVGWRVSFLAGLLTAAGAIAIARPEAFANALDRSPVALVGAGLLVGLGTRIGGGCTSGHGVCGLARWSPRSLAATGTFMAMGMLTATLVRWAGGAT